MKEKYNKYEKISKTTLIFILIEIKDFIYKVGYNEELKSYSALLPSETKYLKEILDKLEIENVE